MGLLGHHLFYEFAWPAFLLVGNLLRWGSRSSGLACTGLLRATTVPQLPPFLSSLNLLEAILHICIHDIPNFLHLFTNSLIQLILGTIYGAGFRTATTIVIADVLGNGGTNALIPPQLVGSGIPLVWQAFDLNALHLSMPGTMGL